MTPEEKLNLAYEQHPLAKAVLDHLGADGDVDSFHTALDAAEHGAMAGWPAFTYYSDTCEFTKKNRNEVVKFVEGEAKEFGEGVIEMIQGFNCLKRDEISQKAVALALYANGYEGEDEDLRDEVCLVENALAWYALEDVGRALENVKDELTGEEEESEE